MGSTPLVSILMPTYNAARYIEQAIDSILGQTYMHWELLVADDASKDNSLKVLKKYQDPRIKCFHNPENLGYLRTCNKLFGEVSGELITFQDSDDWSTLTRLEEQIKFLKNHPAIGIVGTGYCTVDPDGQVLEKLNKPAAAEEVQKHAKEHNPFCGATMMIRRALLDKVGGYQEFFHAGGNEDYDWALRLLEQAPGANIDGHHYYYRQVPQSISRDFKNYHRLYSVKIVHELARQRGETNTDYLLSGDEAGMKKLEGQFAQPYQQDRSLAYREWAAKFMYQQLPETAIQCSWLAIKAAPAKLVNWRTWFYCVRKTYLA